MMGWGVGWLDAGNPTRF